MRTAGLRTDRLSMLSDQFRNTTRVRPPSARLWYGPAGVESADEQGLVLVVVDVHVRCRFRLVAPGTASPRGAPHETNDQHDQVDDQDRGEDVEQQRCRRRRLARLDRLP